MDAVAHQQFADLEEWHFWFRGRRAIFFELLDRLVDGRDDLRVLEIGSGAGGFLRRLGRYGCAVGLEIDPDVSRACGKRSGRPMICGDATALPVRDASQDLVCLFDAIEHMPDEGAALEEVRRVLRPNGVAFFSVPAYQFLYANNDRVAHHCRRYTRGGLARALRRQGLEPVRATYFNSLLFPLILPAVLLGKAKERLVGLQNPDHTNLTVPIPDPVNRLLFRILSSERRLLAHADFPFGHSAIAIARRAEGA